MKGIAPSFIDKEGSGIIKSGSASILTPKPLHSLQHPKGLLNENKRGYKVGVVNPHSGQL